MKKNRCALAYANAPLGTQWGKRILSTLLAVVLCLGLLPGAAFAAGTYTHADVNAVLDRVVKNQTTVGDGDTAYDVDKDGKLTSWDAKRMLDAMPSSIKVNAMQIDGNADSTERPSWVSLEIQDGKLVRTTTINKFWNTLKSFTTQSIYPEAAALNGEDLVLRVSRSSDDTSTSLPDTLLQVDPDSFVACEQPRPSGPAADLYYIPTWDDATTLSNGQLLGVFTDPTANGGIAFFLMDGENNKKITTPKDFPKLVGIAAAGEKDGNELLYGITSGRELYSFTLTKSVDGKLTIGELTALGNSDFPFHDDKGRYFDSASLLYDTASGYLLVAATYFSNASGSLGRDDIASALYLIDPTHPSDYVTVTQRDGVVLNSLYQYTQKSTAGVQLYLSENTISLKAGEDNVPLPTVSAYSYSTDSKGLVTNNKLGDDAVEWTSDNSILTIAADGKSISASEDVTERTTVTLTATATANGQTATGTVTVTVNPNTGSKVGALINTSVDNPDYVWATIDLDNLVAGTFQTVTSDAELENEYTDWNSGQKVKTYWSGGGYAQGLLWGNYYIGNNDNSYYYTLNATTYGDEKTVSETKGCHDSDRQIADLADSPEISEGISLGETTTEASDLARVVFVTQGGNIAWLTGDGTRDSLGDSYSAIAYVGDLKAAQVENIGSLKCDSGSICHVYYALTEDGTLNQVILVPRVGELGDTDHRYSLSETTIGKVTGIDPAYTTSMDLLKTGEGFGLLVARSNALAPDNDYKHSIWYIDLTKLPANKEFSATLKGDLTNTTLTLKKGTVTKVCGVSALYHKGDVTLTDTQILSIAGWNNTQSSQPAPMAAPVISVLSGEGTSTPAEEPTTTDTITVPISADVNATNGKWTVTYPAGKMTLDAVSKDAGVVYYKTYDNGNGILTLAFASRDAIEKDNALFTLTFTGDGSAKDVTVTCDELNKPAGSSSSGGGGGGGSTGTDSAVALPSGVTGGSVSSSTDKAKPGDTVTITVQPDEGYVPGAVTVVDKDGKEIAVKDLGNGKYSFVMPTGKVDVQVTFAPATGGFADVPTDAYYREAVLWAVEKGVTNGVSDTLFGPDQACTRAQIVTFLWRAAGSPEPTAAGGFTDVPADAYYAKAVAWAVENGITTGVAEGVFAPDATCTRAQSVTFLFRALDGTAGTGSSFTDVPADAWYAAAVAWAVEKGVTNGISESRFGPDGDCTRAQIVTFHWRAMK